ncbi:MAG TPA: 30S ribosomal protein S21 [Flavobacteriales bacterium]|jgi:ribosomal protein S21|nr:30S ribosomal protein S21 [Flavobacteriales bacterium]HIK68321.1 30S ribosomal protein S21 [Flavobacteriales bacterium]
MPKVVVRNNNIDAAIRVFKRKVTDSGILMDHRDRQYFEKKSTKVNRNKRAAVVRERRRQKQDGEVRTAS